jgi:hypothetical protein
MLNQRSLKNDPGVGIKKISGILPLSTIRPENFHSGRSVIF